MDMRDVIEYFSGTDFRTLIAMGIMLWFFYSRLDQKIERLDKKLSDKIEKVDSSLSGKIEKVDSSLSGKIDKLQYDMHSLTERVARIEGALMSKDCCMLKDDRVKDKAQ